MECTTASAPSSTGLYVCGFRMSPLCHRTDFDHGGGSGEDVTVDHCGSPERLKRGEIYGKFYGSVRSKS